MKFKIYVVGLNKTERNILNVILPVQYDIVTIPVTNFIPAIYEHEIMKDAACIIINPKKISGYDLMSFMKEYEIAVACFNVPILLFTDSFTREQLKNGIKGYDCFHKINLHSRFDVKLVKTINTLKKRVVPSWAKTKDMFANMFNDGWCLIDIETTGPNPCKDNIIAIRVAYMANYNIQNEEIIYIKQKRDIKNKIEESTGITNKILKNAKSISEAINMIEILRRKSPLIFWSEDFEASFLEAMWNMDGKEFDLPYVALDSFSALIFGYTLRWQLDYLCIDKYEKTIPRSYVRNAELSNLYNVTLLIFEALKSRYNVNAPSDFEKLIDYEYIE